MIKRLLTLAALLAAPLFVTSLFTATSASADWFDDSIAAAKRQRGEVSAPARRARAEPTQRRAAATRVANNDD
ncbi:MAG: hypothetical protein HOO99_06175, partial [Hyphomicrobiaceae bacterium]|nr:hypothetical protein [Hyphomicrobiaceae bacterium]